MEQRLIDAHRLLEELRESCRQYAENGGEFSLWQRDIRIVHEQPTIDAEPHWIPCSERLPKKSGKYYVSGGDKVWICEFLIIPNFTGGWCNDASNPVVQAWMPLPKPYEGDKE